MAQPKFRSRTIVYRSVEYGLSNKSGKDTSLTNRSLEDEVSEAWEQLVNDNGGVVVDLKDNRFIRGMQKTKSVRGGILLHITSLEKDAQMSLISRDLDETGVDLQKARKGNDFMEGDMAILLRGNDILILGNGLNEANFLSFLKEIFKRCGFEEEKLDFRICAQLKADKLALIKKHGVKKIGLGGNISETFSRYLGSKKSTSKEALKNSLVAFMNAFSGGENSLSKLTHSVKTKVSVSIAVDGTGNNTFEFQELAALATEIVDNEANENFTISLNDGPRLNSKEIFISEPVRLKPHGNSVLISHAFQALEDFMRDLDFNGTLET